MDANPKNVVLKFEQLINSRDPGAISEFLSPDSAFVDSMGGRVEGRDKLRAAWEGYFKMVPDYLHSHDEIFAHGNTVAMFGTAQGTFTQDGTLRRENFWKCTAAWRAVIKDGKIALWQVFCDNEPIRALMRKMK
jgi:ketosteroid isomerase-like protein